MADAAASRTCPMCSTAAPAEAAFCSVCGTALGTASAAPASPRLKWYHNVWFVLFMLFFVLGPLGLPLVWKHPRFARCVQWSLTVAMIVYTVLLVQTTVAMVRIVTQHLQQFQPSIPF